jgi:hypothetical protein
MQHPLIVSYYTPVTTYEDHAMVLAEDVRRLGLAARIEPRPARGSWLENCAQKAGFIREMHQQKRRPLLWLDADARLYRKLHELEGITADFAAVRRRSWEFVGGQIYFATGPAATKLLDIWCDYCERFPQIWDQVSLGYAWWELGLQEHFTTQWLEQRLYTRVARRPAVRLLQQLFARADPASAGKPAFQSQTGRSRAAGIRNGQHPPLVAQRGGAPGALPARRPAAPRPRALINPTAHRRSFTLRRQARSIGGDLQACRP